MKALSTGWKASVQPFNVLNVSVYNLKGKLELTAVNKLGKFWLHSTFLAKFHGCSVRNFKSLKQLFLN